MITFKFPEGGGLTKWVNAHRFGLCAKTEQAQGRFVIAPIFPHLNP